MPFMLALSGFKNSGKTFLARALLAIFEGKGLSVGYVKHTDKEVLSCPSTDSGSVAAMRIPALYWGADGLRKEVPGRDMTAENIRSFFPGFDLVLIEGAKSVPLPRIWVGTLRSVPGEVPGIFAVYDRTAAAGDGSFLFSSGEERALADRLEVYLSKSRPPAELYVRGELIPLKPFIAEMLAGTLAGMIGPLKGVNSLRDGADIFLKGTK